MENEQIKERIAIMQAYLNGETIEYYSNTYEEWRLMEQPFFNYRTKYRIKVQKLSFINFLKDNNIDVDVFFENCKIENQRWLYVVDYHTSFRNIFNKNSYSCLTNAFNWDYSSLGRPTMEKLSNDWTNLVLKVGKDNVTFD